MDKSSTYIKNEGLRFAATYQFNFPLVLPKTQNPNMKGQSNFLQKVSLFTTVSCKFY